MMHKSDTLRPGFTIVELLIVIVVIAILASISTVAFSGIQQRAGNAARISDVKKMKSLIDQYVALNGMAAIQSLFSANGVRCLGENYIDVDPGSGTSCGSVYISGNYTYYTTATTLNAALKQLGDISVSRIGPVVSDNSGNTRTISAPQVFAPTPLSSYRVDGRPYNFTIQYHLSGSNVDCGIGPTLRFSNYTSGIYNYTLSSGQINSGYDSTSTSCVLHVEG